jgi:hypothetical protein
VPSGVWAESEYEKLPAYDGTTGEQAEAGAWGVFCCHSSPDELCSGWSHLANQDTLALRAAAAMLGIEPMDVILYRTDVPLWSSHAEAALHGLQDIEHPSDSARAAVEKLLRLLKARADERVVAPDDQEES